MRSTLFNIQGVSKTRDCQIPVTDKLYYSRDSCFRDIAVTYTRTVLIVSLSPLKTNGHETLATSKLIIMVLQRAAAVHNPFF